MGRFERYLGEAEEVVLEYESGIREVLKLKPLPFEDINDLMLIGKDFGDTQNPLDKMTNDTIERMKKVVMKTLKISYPDEPENELKAFAGRNFMSLIPFILDINFRTAKSDRLEKLKARINAGKIPTVEAESK